jgi:two-component SAPR family response regulator
MTLQEIIQSLDDLPMQDQTSLFNVLRSRLDSIAVTKSDEQLERRGENFWEMTLRFRERIEREGLMFTDEDFADLRDRSPVREIEL